jgi:hypothetical protein
MGVALVTWDQPSLVRKTNQDDPLGHTAQPVSALVIRTYGAVAARGAGAPGRPVADVAWSDVPEHAETVIPSRAIVTIVAVRPRLIRSP